MKHLVSNIIVDPRIEAPVGNCLNQNKDTRTFGKEPIYGRFCWCGNWPEFKEFTEFAYIVAKRNDVGNSPFQIDLDAWAEQQGGEAAGWTDDSDHIINFFFLDRQTDGMNFKLDLSISKLQTGKYGAPKTAIVFESIASGNIRIQAVGSSIILENLPNGAKVEVYSLQGKLIYKSSKSLNQINQGSDKIHVQTKGIYIVKIGKFIFRVPMK